MSETTIAEYGGEIACEDEKEERRDQYISICSVLFILVLTNVMMTNCLNNWIIAIFLFVVFAYRESDKNRRNTREQLKKEILIRIFF